ncbi:hypothetical protein GCM10010992_15850 [Cloacibacterium rupense]|uniref:Uncharacterized protein n=1 Tax=Cloacibacterium rupense TaxID=517423 RepID=A0ABQ2NLI8_9FLAO|nr:hypothetical protein [Cloacibacterium rupense]GGP04313.1 hypothetical protein GCM10010992_15850 [Cloacibacterium rupense]
MIVLLGAVAFFLILFVIKFSVILKQKFSKIYLTNKYKSFFDNQLDTYDEMITYRRMNLRLNQTDVTILFIAQVLIFIFLTGLAALILFYLNKIL